MSVHKLGEQASERQDGIDMSKLCRCSFVRCICGRMKQEGYVCPHPRCKDEEGLRFEDLDIHERSAGLWLLR